MLRITQSYVINQTSIKLEEMGFKVIYKDLPHGNRSGVGIKASLNLMFEHLFDKSPDIVAISPDKDIDKVKIGHLVTIESNKQIKKYRLLGSAETNPSQGAISYQSPLGSALLDKQVGEIIEIIINGQAVEYKIIAIKY